MSQQFMHLEKLLISTIKLQYNVFKVKVCYKNQVCEKMVGLILYYCDGMFANGVNEKNIVLRTNG